MEADPLLTAFESAGPRTVGLEEEVMLLDPETLALSGRAPEIVELLGGDPAYKLELPTGQLELITTPHGDVRGAVAELAATRGGLSEKISALARPAAAAIHPFSPLSGKLNSGPRYEEIAAEYGPIARRQLVCSLHVHVAVGGVDRMLAVYNALRGHLPELAAVAANGSVAEGRDTEMASVRPLISGLLPRQGIPPAFSSWGRFADELGWGASAGVLPDSGYWWWELRPNPRFGTLEVRVPDSQSTLDDVEAIASLIYALVTDLAQRHDERALGEPFPSWRIEQNRWSACRRGVEGTLADLRTGERRPTREVLAELIDRLEPAAERIGCAEGLSAARALAEQNGAIRQRRVLAEAGPSGLAGWLAERFEDPFHDQAETPEGEVAHAQPA